MQFRRLILATATAALVAPAAFAASSSTMPMPSCAALESQFDGAIAGKASVAKAADAKALRSEGGKMCDKGMTKQGATYLQSALKIIDVKPKG